MLVGRAQVLEQLGSLLDDARLGRAGARVLTGEAGLGKTSLLEAAVSSAGDFTVLRARGIESEGEISYAVVSELLGQLPFALQSLPAPLRAALEAASALQFASGESAAVTAAWAALLVAASEEQPVLVVVDDIQWADGSSTEAVLFAARRVHDARVATLLALRDPPAARLSVDGIERIVLEPLDDESARQLVGGASPAILASAAGNPLALVELSRRVPAGEREGDVGELLFGARVDALSPPARLALLAAALETSGNAEAVAAAAGTGCVEELRRQGLVTLRGAALELRHPLLRSLVLARAWGAARRRVHASLAAALPAGAEQMRHRALAASEPDAQLADELEALAFQSSAGAQRAWLLARAAELTPAGASRDARSLAAARSAFEIRDIVAARTLIDGVMSRANGALTLERAELEGRLALADGRHLDGARTLRSVAARLADSDPPRAVRLYVAACYVLSTIGQAEEALELARKAAEVRSTGPLLDLLVSSANAEATAAAGRFNEAERMFGELAVRGDRAPEVHADREARLVLVEALYSARQFMRARQVATAAARDARSEGALGDLWLALACLFSIELSCGRFDAAEAAATEELELARGLGRLAERREALGHVAWCHAFKGQAEECRSRVAERVALSEEAGLDATPHASLGLLELGLGNAPAAVDVLGASERRHTRQGLTPAAGVRPCTLDLVEALIRKGDEPQARAVLDAFEDDARRIDRPLARALAHRGRGLLADDESFDAEFSAALRVDLEEPSPFERARTQLCWGERLRRARRRADARTQLHAARDAFADAGASLWAQRAEHELVATGERARERRIGSGRELTPQERRVAVLVSEGLTNREVAARLFVSVNTVETHLRHLFQKLGVRSRTELASRFTDLRDSNEPVPS